MALSDGKIYACPVLQTLFKEAPLRIDPVAMAPSLVIEAIAEACAVRISQMHRAKAPPRAAQGSSDLLDQLARIGWANILKGDPAVGSFVFRLTDAFSMVVSGNSVGLEPDLPFIQCPSLARSTLFDAYTSLQASIGSLSPFFAALARVDSIFFVEKAGPYSNRRRIMHDAANWVEVLFHPDLPASCELAPRADWDPLVDIADNLMRRYGFSTASGSKAVECGVCSSPRDPDGRPAAVNCSNMECQQAFHSQCLEEWLLSDPRTVKSFGRLHGSCPFCDQTIRHGL